MPRAVVNIAACDDAAAQHAIAPQAAASVVTLCVVRSGCRATRSVAQQRLTPPQQRAAKRALTTRAANSARVARTRHKNKLRSLPLKKGLKVNVVYLK